MSPLGGVGINLAIQDAVAAANLLVPSFRSASPGDAELAAVQKRRELPTRLTQRAQVFLQERVVSRVLAQKDEEFRLPLPLELVRSFPVLARLPARMIGLGVRPEHIEVDAAPGTAATPCSGRPNSSPPC